MGGGRHPSGVERLGQGLLRKFYPNLLQSAPNNLTALLFRKEVDREHVPSQGREGLLSANPFEPKSLRPPLSAPS